MALSVKQWLNKIGSGTSLDAPNEAAYTPLDAAALRDVETRVKTELDAHDTQLTGKQSTSTKGSANGYAGLDSNGKLAVSTIPSIVVVSEAGLRPEDFGTIGSGDDGPALRACAAAAVAAAVNNGSGYAEVLLDNTRAYTLSGATVKGGATLGNAQLPIPAVDPAVGQKVTLVIKGGADAAPFLHWNQTVPQRSGAVLRSTLTGQTPDATWGSPSIVGGPTAQISAQDQFSNMRLVLDGVLLAAPINPSVIGVDGRRIAQMDVPNLGVLAQGIPFQIQVPNDSNGIGVYFPRPDNNDSCNIGVLAVEGFYYGLAYADHLVAERIGVIYANTAMFINDSDGGWVHGSSIQYASIEACPTILEANTSAATFYPLTIDQLNAEVVAGTAFKDVHNALRGSVDYTCVDNSGADLSVSGCAGLRLRNLYRSPGQMTAPSVPATTVASTPIHATAAVTVAAGTSTCGIAVDGQTVGTLPANGVGTVIVPAGKTIALTYSNAPTWKWTVL